MELGEPPPKRHCASQCIICLKKLTGDVVKNPSPRGLQTLIDACEIWNDDTANGILPIEDKILSGEYPVSFHKTCRGTYTSKFNLKYAEKKKAEDITDKEAEERSSSSDPVPVRLTRGQSASSQFNIRSSCFVCGSSSFRKEKLTPVTFGTGESTRKKVLKAAEDTNNDVVFQRMVAHPDLFAYDAKYHRTCYSHLISIFPLQYHHSIFHMHR